MTFVNKKAQLGEQVMMFAFVLLIVVVGGGVVIGTYLFIGPEFDFRGVEANLLSYKIARCISPGSGADVKGFWLDNLANKDSIALLAKKCDLNEEVIEKNNLIKICVDEPLAADCILSGNDKKIAFSTGGDFQPCNLAGGEKILGCSITPVGKYMVIATSRQVIRRSAQ